MSETQKPQEAKPEEAQKPKEEETKETLESEKVELPPVNFTNFINSLASTAFAYMGGLVNPETQKPIIELNLAKHHIDTIEMLQQKTKGNLTVPENNFLENTLYNLRMTYIRMASAPPSDKEPESEQSKPSPESESKDEVAPSSSGQVGAQSEQDGEQKTENSA
jgi:hypothetical protein